MRRLPPTSGLEAFLATANGKSLKSASESLSLSPSALSRRIQKLEAYVGVALFDRNPHEMTLTGAGERLLHGIAPAFEQMGDVLDELRDEKEHQLTIGVPQSFATSWLMPRLHRFRQQNPDIALNLDSSGSPVPKLGVSLDAIILFARKDEYPIQLHELRPQRAFCVTSPGLLDIRMGIRKALQEQPLLLHSALPEILPNWLAAVGLSKADISRKEYSDNGGLLMSLAENGLGIAVVLEDMVNFYSSDANIVRPFGEIARTPYSYCLAVKPTTGAVRSTARFRDWILAEAAQDAGSAIQAGQLA